jgi:hypothetical protein
MGMHLDALPCLPTGHVQLAPVAGAGLSVHTAKAWQGLIPAAHPFTSAAKKVQNFKTCVNNSFHLRVLGPIANIFALYPAFLLSGLSEFLSW